MAILGEELQETEDQQEQATSLRHEFHGANALVLQKSTATVLKKDNIPVRKLTTALFEPFADRIDQPCCITCHLDVSREENLLPRPFREHPSTVQFVVNLNTDENSALPSRGKDQHGHIHLMWC